MLQGSDSDSSDGNSSDSHSDSDRAVTTSSAFVRTNEAIFMDFSKNSDDSWVILSVIEKSIKEKIEKAGTPLKDWDINIYRGVLTGFNEAFIIDESTRQGILSDCKTAAEKKKTDALIRRKKGCGNWRRGFLRLHCACVC